MDDLLEKRLCDAFPSYCRRLPLNQGDECFQNGNGWYDLIVKLCLELDNLFKTQGDKEKFYFFQVKNKFGRLRIYWGYEGEDAETKIKINSIVLDKEFESGGICELCGAEWTSDSNTSKWQSTCSDCESKKKRD